MAGSPSPTTAHHRARLAALTTSVRAGYRHPDELDEVRGDLAAAKLEDHVRRVLDTAPRPSDEKLAKIASLLLAGGGPNAAA
jgi:hypothetical protein